MNLQKTRSGSTAMTWWACLSLAAALGLVQGQSPTTTAVSSTPTITPPTATTTLTPSPTTTTTTTTTISVTTVSPTSPITVTTIPSATTPSFTTTAISSDPLPPPTTASTLPPTTSTLSTTFSPTPTIGTSRASTSSNVPVIVGSVAGIIAVIIIVATTIICFRRRRRNNRELTFDPLQGIGASGAASRQRASQRYTTNNTGPATVGMANIASGGYDDGYDYGAQSNVVASQAYGNGHGVYPDNGYDTYGAHQQAYQNPSIFQEDSLAYAGAMGRSRAGYDQNLPEIMYRNGDDLGTAGDTTGYYDDNMYNQQAGWNQSMSGGYIGPKGLWIANPTAPYQQEYQQEYHPEQQTDIELHEHQSAPVPMSYEKNSINQYDNSSDTVVDSASSPSSKFRGHNPQALPESPRSQQLRGGDLFGEDANAAPSSPRTTAAAAGLPAPGNPQDTTRAATPPLNSSPRLMSRGDMRSFEMARHSPTRSSGEGVQSYANDYVGGRPSVSDRPSLDSGSNLNPGKSLRTQRREDWS
ncbi:hypothetical protein BGZ54_006239 [Gamsiella multidivaricata]|nr:hypothetical protein BGZ54_006239 [Gamsiella multidivaricata]